MYVKDYVNVKPLDEILDGSNHLDGRGSVLGEFDCSPFLVVGGSAGSSIDDAGAWNNFANVL